MTRILLEKGKERSILRRHPWIFAASVQAIDGREVKSIDVLPELVVRESTG